MWIYAVGINIIFIATLNGQVTKTKFSCDGRTSGYYADVGSGCRVYHMCDGLGRQFSYTCPNATLFQQRMLICDHWYMVNCSKSESDYSANLRIGQREMPFVDDSELNPYHRTPRPDLLSHQSESEYDIIYRTGRAQLNNKLNLVGVESDSKNVIITATDKPTYNPPTHWSTEYSQQASTTKPLITKPLNLNLAGKKTIDNNNAGKKKRIIPFNTAPTPSSVNFQSSFKATTPVFPTSVESNSQASDDLGLVPPLQQNIPINKEVGGAGVSFITTTESSNVNFKSSFQATTPVYPTFVESNTQASDNLLLVPPFEQNNPNNNKVGGTGVSVTTATETSNVNFKSSFQATTPVFPKDVEANTGAPDALGLLPPLPYKNLKNNVAQRNNFPIKPRNSVNFASSFKATTPVYPQVVEVTSVEPSDLGILPPAAEKVNNNLNTNQDTSVPQLSLAFLPPKVDNNAPKRDLSEVDVEVPVPSKFYQPPKFDPDYTQLALVQKNTEAIKTRNNGPILRSFSNEQWENLKKKFLIPDYDFPLESASRPSYDSVLSSFEVMPGSMEKSNV